MSLQTRLPKEQIEAEIGRRSLYEFVKLTWGIVKPGEAFQDNWHIELLCNYFQACYEGKVRRLLINIPPRHMKSMVFNIFGNAWVWAKDPSKKFVYVANGADNLERDSVLTRDLITSDFYKVRWGNYSIKKDQNQKLSYHTTKGGSRNSFVIGGGITGSGGDFVIVDDPNQVSTINSDAERKNINWIFDQALSNRANPKDGVTILIQQRLHDEDVTGHILSSEAGNEWEKLILPAEYEGTRYVSSLGEKYNDPRTEMGTPLWIERFGLEALAYEKKIKTANFYAGQYQQRPSPIAGNIFKKEWFTNRKLNTDIIARYISWDTASSISDSAAYSSCTVGEITSKYQLYIREVYREKLEFPQLKNAIEVMAKRYKYKLNGIIIESKSSGISVEQSLRQSSEDWIKPLLVPFTPTADKVTRAYQTALWCENGSVLLPPPDESTPWLFDFEEELFTFPNSKFKDQTDSCNQLVLYLENYLSAGLKARG
jgi:predicted phage terminase large subunit-like protein